MHYKVLNKFIYNMGERITESYLLALLNQQVYPAALAELKRRLIESGAEIDFDLGNLMEAKEELQQAEIYLGEMKEPKGRIRHMDIHIGNLGRQEDKVTKLKLKVKLIEDRDRSEELKEAKDREDRGEGDYFTS